MGRWVVVEQQYPLRRYRWLDQVGHQQIQPIVAGQSVRIDLHVAKGSAQFIVCGAQRIQA